MHVLLLLSKSKAGKPATKIRHRKSKICKATTKTLKAKVARRLLTQKPPKPPKVVKPPKQSHLVKVRLAQEKRAAYLAERNALFQKKYVTFNRKMLHRVDTLDFSIRTLNCFKNNDIVYIGDLITKTEKEIFDLRNFGKTCFDETKKILSEYGYTFNMHVSGWHADSKPYVMSYGDKKK